jgi:hypothetical protein
MKVNYCVRETLTFSGEVEIDCDDYNNWKNKEESVLGNLILDIVGRDNPTDCEVDSVDDFEPAASESEDLISKAEEKL